MTCFRAIKKKWQKHVKGISEQADNTCMNNWKEWIILNIDKIYFIL